MKKVARPPKAIAKYQVVLDQAYLRAALELVSKARKSVDLMAYSFAIGSAGGKLAKSGVPFQLAFKLRSLAEQGVRIRFFTEGERSTNLRNRVTAEFLEESGVEVRYGPTHAKGLLVDGRFVLFGSTNLTNQSIAKNREANLLVDDRKVAGEFRRYFEHYWEGGLHGGIKLDPPMLADGDFEETLLRLLEQAKKTVEFSIYFFNHRRIEAALVEAHQRGVEITGFIHQHRSFALSYIRANRRTVRRLRQAGLADIHFSTPDRFYHAKYLVVDGTRVLLGTGNWLEEDVHIHPQLHLEVKDASVARALLRHLKSQIKENASGD